MLPLESLAPKLSAQQDVLVVHQLQIDDQRLAMSFFYWAVKQSKHQLHMELYQTMLTSLVNAGLIEEAQGVLKFMIRTFGQAGNIREAMKLVFDLSNGELALNIHTFNSVLRAVCEMSISGLAEEFYAEMIANDISPDSCTYKTMISSFCREGRLREADRFLRKMLEKGFEANVVTYTVIINAYCRRGHMGRAFGLFEKMLQTGCPPNVITYTTLINGLCKMG
jgi:pentatricopeptide repeat protein